MVQMWDTVMFSLQAERTTEKLRVTGKSVQPNYYRNVGSICRFKIFSSKHYYFPSLHLIKPVSNRAAVLKLAVRRTWNCRHVFLRSPYLFPDAEAVCLTNSVDLQGGGIASRFRLS